MATADPSRAERFSTRRARSRASHGVQAGERRPSVRPPIPERDGWGPGSVGAALGREGDRWCCVGMGWAGGGRRAAPTPSYPLRPPGDGRVRFADRVHRQRSTQRASTLQQSRPERSPGASLRPLSPRRGRRQEGHQHQAGGEKNGSPTGRRRQQAFQRGAAASRRQLGGELQLPADRQLHVEPRDVYPGGVLVQLREGVAAHARVHLDEHGPGGAEPHLHVREAVGVTDGSQHGADVSKGVALLLGFDLGRGERAQLQEQRRPGQRLARHAEDRGLPAPRHRLHAELSSTTAARIRSDTPSISARWAGPAASVATAFFTRPPRLISISHHTAFFAIELRAHGSAVLSPPVILADAPGQ